MGCCQAAALEQSSMSCAARVKCEISPSRSERPPSRRSERPPSSSGENSHGDDAVAALCVAASVAVFAAPVPSRAWSPKPVPVTLPLSVLSAMMERVTPGRSKPQVRIAAEAAEHEAAAPEILGRRASVPAVGTLSRPPLLAPPRSRARTVAVARPHSDALSVRFLNVLAKLRVRGQEPTEEECCVGGPQEEDSVCDLCSDETAAVWVCVASCVAVKAVQVPHPRVDPGARGRRRQVLPATPRKPFSPHRATPAILPPPVPSANRSKCKNCRRSFGLTRRRCHCVMCGDLYCPSCADTVLPAPPHQPNLWVGERRICIVCCEYLLPQYDRSSLLYGTMF
eukprot:TRINITY_DN4304_c1_g1_i1.p1 TRINITY_DN4304_c1_g1~~TRINITY_DN4304_c1_g1_i1.p1  ORF type:complete len:362 (+),score=35.39 TRINITY_DN4304_c1_g1_i1:72-1088(+)